MAIRFLLLALLAPVVARGQATGVERYFPLDVGDRWVWAADESDGLAPWYHRMAVVGDTLIGGEPYAVAVAEELIQLYLPVASARCALRLAPVVGWPDEYYDVEAVRVRGTAPCLPPLIQTDGPDLVDGPGFPETYEIGGVPYTFDEVQTVPYGSTISDGEGKFAAGVGFLGGRLYGFGGDVWWSGLVYAEVGGETYGVEPQAAPVPDPARFYPLGLGDTWVFYHHDRLSSPAEVWEVRTVVGDTTLGGAAYALVARERRDRLDGALIEEALCAVRYVGGWFEWEAVSGTCDPIEEELQGWGPVTDSSYVLPDCEETIGGLSYEVDYCFRKANDGGLGWYRNEVRFAADIGFVYYGGAGVGGCGWCLSYAHVGGVEYGEGNPVAVEPPAEGPEALALEAVSPNPFRASVTLTLSLPSAEAVTVEAFDALGRRVLARALGVLAPGRHRVEFDGRAWAPGVYVVRVTTGAGEVATRRVVRAE
jgi:hypothetical protein